MRVKREKAWRSSQSAICHNCHISLKFKAEKSTMYSFSTAQYELNIVLCKVCVSDFYGLDDLDFFCSHKRSSRWEKKRWAKRPNCNYELKLCCQSAAATLKVPAVLMIRNLNKSWKGARLLKVLFFAILPVSKKETLLSVWESASILWVFRTRNSNSGSRRTFGDKKSKFLEPKEFLGQESRSLRSPIQVTHQQLSSAFCSQTFLFDLFPAIFTLFDWKFSGAKSLPVIWEPGPVNKM